jgi:hypothetical protein
MFVSVTRKQHTLEDERVEEENSRKDWMYCTGVEEVR